MGKRIIIGIILLLAVFSACTSNYDHQSRSLNSVDHDLSAIIESGKLRAVIDFNSVDYFIYKGEPMGFHYELLQTFADKLGVDLELTVVENTTDAYNLLNEGETDVVAMGLIVNSSGKENIMFTEPLMESRQVLVQRKPLNWDNLTAQSLERHLIRNQLDLAYKTVYVEENSPQYKRLVALAEEIGDTINVVGVPYDEEYLIEGVAYGDIDYTVVDECMALVSTTYYTNIDVSTPVSFPQNISWGVRKYHSEELLKELNEFIGSYRGTVSYANLYAKYFKNNRTGIIVNSDYYSLYTGKISRWDDLIKEASEEIGWDWRLVSALVYQESRFDPDVVSWAGAYGLMQIMPVTGENLGVDITTASPKENIATGIKYLKYLDSYFEELVTDENERLKFVLASYNAGPGHVVDAMRLAEKNGENPQIWDGNVSEWLLKKSDPQYYNDTSVKYGYSRGEESVSFVTEILERYDHYKNIAPEESVNKLTQNRW